MSGRKLLDPTTYYKFKTLQFLIYYIFSQFRNFIENLKYSVQEMLAAHMKRNQYLQSACELQTCGC